MRHCSSQVRCLSPLCDTCAWRFTGTLWRDLADEPGRRCAVELQIGDPTRFQQERIAIRNFVDYLRRKHPAWRSLGLHLFLGRDGKLRGVASLGLVSPGEAQRRLSTRWPTSLRVVEPADLRLAIWHALKPRVIWNGPVEGRYWTRRISIWARRAAPMAAPANNRAAMPLIVGIEL
jgi:hypothetical protein